MFVGIDVGGANTKIGTSDGFVDSLYAPLWKDKVCLYDVLPEVNHKFGTEIEAVGVVMTGELSDCFETKREGVLHIKHALSATFEAPKFFDVNCTFKDGSEVDRDPLVFAATNWLASSKLIAEQYKDVIFVDIGSTTTDVIPIVGSEIKAQRTDLERLKSGELIYSGILRTNIVALLKNVYIGEQDEECSVSSELFAITADAYLVLGNITKDDYGCDSPNSYAFVSRENEEKSRLSAMRRLSRVVCSDLEEIGEDGAVRIAEQVKRAQVDELSASLRSLKETYGLEMVVAAGIGDFVVKEAADSVNIRFLSLSSSYGKNIAATFPAFAVAKLLEKNL
ncbi:MAG TPA: hydantoinase/oxoprolinase family protein [Candidatus Bathyarchaeia archaeon]|nr:hydantoinase/oxoprolinase family protein [Candidatus Bathyarchaeia archaeon]